MENNSKKEWFCLENFSDYVINKRGEVKNCKTNKILSQFPNDRGYMCVNLLQDNKYKLVKIHRLLAITFLGLKEGQHVDHKNRNSSDNRLENLRCCTYSENNLNRKTNKLSKKSKYKGVKPTYSNTFQAMVTINGKHFRKNFKTEVEAAIQYNKWLEEHCPEFAVYNEL